MAMTRVCLYTRISTDEENQPTSLHSQKERLEAFCSSQEDLRVVAHHEDCATGTKLDRPGLQAALDLARRGGADLLLVYRVDRLSRKVRQLSQLAEELDRLNVVLRSATEPFDTGSAAGRMMLQMLGVFAEFEHATIVDRITAGIERRAKQGYWPNGRVPYGYRRNDAKELMEEEREAPIVRRIFDLYTAGRHGAVSIARLLDAEQAPARNGQGWLPSVVLWILSNEAYVGRVHWRGQTFPGKHAGLVDEATFERAQALLKERGEDCAQRVGQRSDFLLSGLLRCGRCRRAYVRRHERQRQRRPLPLLRLLRPPKRGPKACDGDRIPREKLEDAVIEQLADIYRDGHLIRQAIEATSENEDTERAAVEDRRASVAAEPSTATSTPSRTVTSTPNASRTAWTPSRPSSTPSRTRTSSSPTNWRQKRLIRPTLPSCTPPPTPSKTRSAKATPNTPRRSCASSSKSCASTPAPRSCPPTASPRPWFARRPVQWAILDSNQGPLPYQRSALTD